MQEATQRRFVSEVFIIVFLLHLSFPYSTKKEI